MPRFSSKQRRRCAGHTGKRNRHQLVATVALAVAAEAGALWLRARRLGGNVVVRCHDGHLFTTIWVPGGSLKALRLGWWRFQRCPVGHHWSLVTPVRESELTTDERQLAHEYQDIRIP